MSQTGLIENTVFLELLRRGYRVSVGKLGAMDTGFLAEKDGAGLCVMVSQSAGSPEARDRELMPLRVMPGSFEKIVLSMDRTPGTDSDGIRTLSLTGWLPEKCDS